MQVFHLYGFAKFEVVDVDNEFFWDIGGKGFHTQFTHFEREFTTSAHTSSVAFEFDGQFTRFDNLAQDVQLPPEMRQ